MASAPTDAATALESCAPSTPPSLAPPVFPPLFLPPRFLPPLRFCLGGGPPDACAAPRGESSLDPPPSPPRGAMAPQGRYNKSSRFGSSSGPSTRSISTCCAMRHAKGSEPGGHSPYHPPPPSPRLETTGELGAAIAAEVCSVAVVFAAGGGDPLNLSVDGPLVSMGGVMSRSAAAERMMSLTSWPCENTESRWSWWWGDSSPESISPPSTKAPTPLPTPLPPPQQHTRRWMQTLLLLAAFATSQASGCPLCRQGGHPHSMRGGCFPQQGGWQVMQEYVAAYLRRLMLPSCG